MNKKKIALISVSDKTDIIEIGVPLDDYYGLVGRKKQELRYGENPWQKSYGLFENYNNEDPLALSNFQIKAGQMGHVNWTDVDRMLQTMTHIMAALDKNTFCTDVSYVAIGAKHGNPCGAGFSHTTEDALEKMLEGNLLSIFGGGIMTTFPIRKDEAEVISFHKSEDNKRRTLDLVICPSITEEAIDILKRKGDACKILCNPVLLDLTEKDLDVEPLLRKVRGGFLVQENYTYVPHQSKLSLDSVQEIEDVLLAWAVGSTSNSNTITLVKNGKLIGNGVGQMDRVEAAQLAVKRATDMEHDLTGSVAYSDSFFPFTDAPRVLIDAGVKIIYTASGSVRDQEVKDFCAKKGVKLIFYPNKEGRGFFGH